MNHYFQVSCLLGYENIQQDWNTITDPCASSLQKVLAGGDLALNAVLGVLMFSGIGSSLRTWRGASQLSKLGYLEQRLWYLRNLMPKGATVNTLNKSTMMKVFGTEFFRPLGQKMIYISREALKGNGKRLWGGFRHELTHVMQEFGTLGRLAKPWQRLSAWSGSFNRKRDILKAIPFAFEGYLLNPIEVHAFSKGVISGINRGYLFAGRFMALIQNEFINGAPLYNKYLDWLQK